MNKNIFSLLSIFVSISIFAQFEVKIKSNNTFTANDAILYTLNGSKDVVVAKTQKTNNQWLFKVPFAYSGMMKVYFPETNASLNMISENKNIDFSFSTNKNKIESVVYNDDSNKLMDQVQDIEQKKEVILPVLYQMQEYYTKNGDFKGALEKEVQRLTIKQNIDISKHPFIAFYNTNYNKFIVKDPKQPAISQDQILQFISNSNEYLETSSLLRPVLTSFLNSASKSNVDASVDQLLAKLNVETPRGQVVLSELIDLFDAYGMTTLKDKYLGQARGLKCTINDRLARTIDQNKNTELGATFPDYIFQNTKNSKVISLSKLKASHKVIVFWSSTCSHCETELPKFIPIYDDLKKLNVEIVGFSLDTDKGIYDNKTSAYPWVNVSELKGWNSSFVETYNIHATPTYFILDADDKIVDKPDHIQDVLQYFNLKKSL